MSIELAIVTPEGERYSGDVEGVVLPGVEGDFGVLAGHERFLTPVRIGEVEIRERGRARWAAISDGFAEATARHVVLLVETCELAEEIDAARAESARERRERELAELARTEPSEQRLLLARAGLNRALTRIAVARRS